MLDDNYYDLSYKRTVKDNTKIFIIKWTILDFKRLSEENSKFVIMEKNHKNIPEDSKFRLLITKVLHENKGEILKFSYSPPLPVEYVKYSLYIIHSGGRKSLSEIDYVWSTNTKWTSMVEQSKQDVLESLSHNCLVLEYEFCVKSKPYNEEDLLEAPVVSSIKNDFGNLLISSLLSDVKVKSAEGVELSAHKNILAVRSAVFKAHFEHGTKESMTNVIENQFETEVLTDVLRYIYTDKLPDCNGMLQKIFLAADFYQLEGLKVFCENELRKKLSVENVIDILQLAELHSAKILKMSAVTFIKFAHREIIKTDAYKALESVEMIKRIHEYALMEN